MQQLCQEIDELQDRIHELKKQNSEFSQMNASGNNNQKYAA